MTQNRMIAYSSRRSGGREARRNLRAAPLAEDLQPIRAGLEGGNFKPLDAAAVQAVDKTVYQILEEIGLSQAPDSGVKYMTDAGAILGDDGRLRFPRGLVEDTLAKCARNIALYGQNPKHDLLLSGSRVHYGTAGAATQRRYSGQFTSKTCFRRSRRRIAESFQNFAINGGEPLSCALAYHNQALMIYVHTCSPFLRAL